VILLLDLEIDDNVVIGAGRIIYQSVSLGSVIINKQQLITH
jgi:serine acetyltransferase